MTTTTTNTTTTTTTTTTTAAHTMTSTAVQNKQDLSLQILRGAEVSPYIDQLTQLFITGVSGWPFYTQVDSEFKRGFLKKLTMNPKVIMGVVLDRNEVAGALYGNSLDAMHPSTLLSFNGHPYPLNQVFLFDKVAIDKRIDGYEMRKALVYQDHLRGCSYPSNIGRFASLNLVIHKSFK